MAEKKQTEYNKTVPWLGHEYAVVDGAKLIYEIDSKTSAIKIRFPGGAVVSADRLRKAGSQVIVPPAHMLRKHQVIV